MAGFCMSGAATRIRARVRVRSPSQHYRKTASFIKSRDKSDGMNEFTFNTCPLESESESGNKVMVVVDSGPEAKVALDWALSHTVQSHDTIILMRIMSTAFQKGKPAVHLIKPCMIFSYQALSVSSRTKRLQQQLSNVETEKMEICESPEKGEIKKCEKQGRRSKTIKAL